MNSCATSIVFVTLWLIIASMCLAKEKVYRKDGDLIIGGIIPVHLYDDSTRRCQELRDLSALRRVEAIHYAISKINDDNSRLSDITLGYEIYDSCSSPVETLKNALNFIPPLRTEDNIIGVVGPQRSSSSLQATNLLGLYNISLVSFLSTSDELSDSDRFPYFIRTVPPDKFQVSVISDILNKYYWKYVAFIYSDDSYGKNAEAEFRTQIKENDICIGYARSISSSEDSSAYEEVIRNLVQLKEESLVSVVILFTQVETASKIFKQASMANLTRDFIWIGSDGWGNYDLTPVQGAEESALGAFTIVPKAELNPDFNDYFETTISNTSNPWAPEYFEECNCTFFTEIPLPPYESIVIDSVEVIARGLDDMRRSWCSNISDKDQCLDVLINNRRILRDYLLNVSFTSESNGLVSFTGDGDSNGRYEIRYLMKEETTYQFKSNGTWLEKQRPKLVVGPVPWYLNRETNPSTYTEENVPKSVCSDPCRPTEVSRMTLQDCCWSCASCEDHEIIVENECLSCFIEINQTYLWPHPELTHCVALDDLQLIDEIENVIFLVTAILGIIAQLLVAYLYIKNRQERLIRASSRELGYIILVGIFLAYCSAILYCIPEHVVSCYLRRIVPSIATTFIYVSLLTMTVRLYRIFSSGKKTTKRPNFISPSSQVCLTMVISIIPVLPSCVMLSGTRWRGDDVTFMARVIGEFHWSETRTTDRWPFSAGLKGDPTHSAVNEYLVYCTGKENYCPGSSQLYSLDDHNRMKSQVVGRRAPTG